MNNNWTFAFWIRLLLQNTAFNILDQSDCANSAQLIISINSAGFINLSNSIGTTTTTVQFDTNWNHIALSSDGDNLTITKNLGSPVANAIWSRLNKSCNVNIGFNASSTTKFFMLKEFKILFYPLVLNHLNLIPIHDSTYLDTYTAYSLNFDYGTTGQVLDEISQTYITINTLSTTQNSRFNDESSITYSLSESMCQNFSIIANNQCKSNINLNI